MLPTTTVRHFGGGSYPSCHSEQWKWSKHTRPLSRVLGGPSRGNSTQRLALPLFKALGQVEKHRLDDVIYVIDSASPVTLTPAQTEQTQFIAQPPTPLPTRSATVVPITSAAGAGIVPEVHSPIRLLPLHTLRPFPT